MPFCCSSISSSPSPYPPSPARSENLGIRSPNGQKPKLLDQVREAIRTRHYSWRTEQTYVQWIKRFIFFHEKKHPLAMSGPEVTRFLSALAVEQHVSAATQSQALSALLQDEKWLMAALLYGTGLRLMECLHLRVKDIDFARNQITVREGKGNKDRLTMLPTAVKEPLARHLDGVREQHERDLANGFRVWPCQMPWNGSISMRTASGAGNGFSPRPRFPLIHVQKSSVAIIYTSPSYIAP